MNTKHENMVRHPFKAVILLVTVGLAHCSSLERSKWTDVRHRILIDPQGLDANDYVRLRTALVQTGRFHVVDRKDGYAAIKAEADRIHKDESDRYENKEKWLHWGKMYSVGAIAVGHSQCQTKTSFWKSQPFLSCLQSLAVINSNTGEVMVSVEGDGKGGEAFYGEVLIKPEWKETVNKMVEQFPKHFEAEKYHERVQQYRELSAEEAQRREEKNLNGR